MKDMKGQEMKRLSLKDVAKMAGVAPSTVSFVLNGKARQMRISDELAEKVMAVVKKTGYQPHSVAVNLRTGQSKTLGLIVESISGSFFAALARVIETEADRFGYNIVYCSTENNARKGSDLIRMLSRQQVDGYFTSFATDKAAWGPDSENIKLIAGLQGGTPADHAERIKTTVVPPLAEQLSDKWLGGGENGGVARILKDTAGFLKEQRKITAVKDNYGVFADPQYAAAAKVSN